MTLLTKPQFFVGNGGVIGTTIRDYHPDPFPHSLVRARENHWNRIPVRVPYTGYYSGFSIGPRNASHPKPYLNPKFPECMVYGGVCGLNNTLTLRAPTVVSVVHDREDPSYWSCGRGR